MSERDSKGREIVSVLRVIEYKGPKEWITATFEHCRVPVQGTKVILDINTKEQIGLLRSGLIFWQDESTEVEARPIAIPPGTGNPV